MFKLVKPRRVPLRRRPKRGTGALCSAYQYMRLSQKEYAPALTGGPESRGEFPPAGFALDILKERQKT